MSLRTLFVDMNAYFASVEQQDDPRLRGKPLGIVPVKQASASCCIAVSYEAKWAGVKGGMGFREAKGSATGRCGRHGKEAPGPEGDVHQADQGGDFDERPHHRGDCLA